MTYAEAKEIYYGRINGHPKWGGSDCQHREIFREAVGFLEAFAIAEKLAEALKNLIDTNLCWYDHHGLCQEHNLENPCSNQIAKDTISEFEKAKESK